MKVLKFGGSILSTPVLMKSVVKTIWQAGRKEQIVVVTSAFEGVTNKLLDSAKLAANHDKRYKSLYIEIVKNHLHAVNNLISENSSELIGLVELLLKDLKLSLDSVYESQKLDSVYESQKLTLKFSDYIASFGERLSTTIIAYTVNTVLPAAYVDARDLIITDDAYTNASVLIPETYEAIQTQLASYLKANIIPVIPGFIARSQSGETTTLGRNSSDYSAAIIAAAMNADSFEKWTNVNGIYSGHSSLIKNAATVPEMSYEEALESSHFGNKVLHRQTMLPLMRTGTPISVRSIYLPKLPGTTIVRCVNKSNNIGKISCVQAAKNLTSIRIKHLAESINSKSIARIFGQLHKWNANAYLIVNYTAPHELDILLQKDYADEFLTRLKDELQIKSQRESMTLEVKPNRGVIAIIGNMIANSGMTYLSLIASALSKTQPSIETKIGSHSDHTITLLVDESHVETYLELIHNQLIKDNTVLGLFVVGTGRVGSCFLDKLQRINGSGHQHMNIAVCGIARSTKFLFDKEGLSLLNWRSKLEKAPSNNPLQDIKEHISKTKYSNVVVIDCTASRVLPEFYADFAQEGADLIAANKQASSLPFKKYQLLLNKIQNNNKRFFNRTNVGAGLPILVTIDQLLAANDPIVKIEAQLSGTLSYLFNHYDPSNATLSSLVKKARDIGLCEPDPRVDLCGTDVARKLLIIARHMGYRVNMSDVKYQKLIPQKLAKGEFSDSFYDDYVKYEKKFMKFYEAAKKEKKVLRYVARIETDENKIRLTAKIEKLEKSDPLADCSQTDNVVVFYTKTYSSPLIIQGPGAGAEVTAQGVYQDVLKLIGVLSGPRKVYGN